jgi:hypothetical protein
MYTGRARFALVSAALFSTLVFLSCSNRGKARVEISSVPKEETSLDVQKELSGIWYHSRYEKITTAMEDRFSWGVTTYDYWKALRIDLLGDRNFLGFADATWDNVTADVDSKNKNVIRVHLKQKASPAKDEAIIALEGNGIILLSFGSDVDTGTTRMIAGKYYKVFDPGNLPDSNKEAPIGHK